MKYSKTKLKFKKSDNINELIRIFEENSLIIKNVKDMKLLIAKIVLILSVFIVIFAFIKNYKILAFTLILLFTILLFLYIFKCYCDSTYKHTIKIDGRKISFLDPKNIGNGINFNLNLMRKEEENLILKILKINRLYNKECIRLIIKL